LFGEALPGSSAVPVEVAAETQVRANSNGKYNLDIDTSGIPAGEDKIDVAGETKTIQIGGSSPDTSTSSGPTTGISSQNADDATSEETPDQKAKPVATTSEVIHWYANETGRPLAKTNPVTDSKNLNESQSSNESRASGPVREEGLMERIGDWVNQLFGAH
jgi:hypothetical protein